MAPIEILTGECARHAVVALDGELDATGSGHVEAAVADVVAAGRSVIVDLAGLDYIDCAALGALRRWQAKARAAGGDVLVASPGGVVVRLLTVTGMADPAWVYATVAAALAAKCDASGQYGTGRPAVVAVRRGRAAASGTDPV